MKLNNPTRDLTPLINELEKHMTDDQIGHINSLLDSIKPMSKDELEALDRQIEADRKAGKRKFKISPGVSPIEYD